MQGDYSSAIDNYSHLKTFLIYIRGRSMNFKSLKLAAAITLAGATFTANAADADVQAEIAELKAQINALADAMDEQSAGFGNGVSIGGYGELHANIVEGKDNKIDFHRFVLFVNKEFNSRTRLFTELEIEHSFIKDGVANGGAVELEQAYIQYDINDKLQSNSGLFLIPIGILNETHEPDTFYGVERNSVEKNIIPTTWWEAGTGLTAKLADGLTLDAAVHSGLKMTKTNDDGTLAFAATPRSGRQKVANAKFDSLAVTTRIKYTAVPGLELGAAINYQADVLQGKVVDGQANIDGTLLEAHAVYQTGGLGVRALYAQWNFDDAANELKAGSAKQTGYYIEPSYRVGNLGGFVRYSAFDNTADAATDTEVTQMDIGANYYLTDTVVFKGDYAVKEDGAGKETKTFNLGVGYSF